MMSVVDSFFSSLPRKSIDNWAKAQPTAVITIIRLVMSRAGVRDHREIACLISSYIGINEAYRHKPPEPGQFHRHFAEAMGLPLDHPMIINQCYMYISQYEDGMRVWRTKYPKSAQTLDYLAKKKKEAEASKTMKSAEVT
jgi:hypothetical protein